MLPTTTIGFRMFEYASGASRQAYHQRSSCGNRAQKFVPPDTCLRSFGVIIFSPDLLYPRPGGGMAYAGDLKSPVLYGTCGFDPHPGHV